nr:MAG TPA: hypothetical protein [Caudoviricetes sp.]
MTPLHNGDGEPTHSREMENVAGFEAIHASSLKCVKGVLWKGTPAHYFLNNLEENIKLSKQLQNGSYKAKPTKKFKVFYPKERDIVSVHFRDRIFQRSLNDNILYPEISRSFIYDNMACQTGKGPDKARERLKCFLQKFYRKYGVNGYILKCDIKGYYPNMSHKVVKSCFEKVIDGWSLNQACNILDNQYDREIGYNPGSQMIQIAGIGLLNAVDHFIKEQLRIKYYIRYMDDFILIHEDRAYLLECQKLITQMLARLECKFNAKKTGIVPVSDGVLFLGFHYRLTSTGKVIMTLSPANVKHERRKLRRLVRLAKDGKRTRDKVDECYNSWKNHASKGNSKKLLLRMNKFYRELWKENNR